MHWIKSRRFRFCCHCPDHVEVDHLFILSLRSDGYPFWNVFHADNPEDKIQTYMNLLLDYEHGNELKDANSFNDWFESEMAYRNGTEVEMKGIK